MASEAASGHHLVSFVQVISVKLDSVHGSTFCLLPLLCPRRQVVLPCLHFHLTSRLLLVCVQVPLLCQDRQAELLTFSLCISAFQEQTEV